MMRISIFLPDLRAGGAERVNIDLAREFARREHEVEFVLMRAQGEFLSEVRSGFRLVDLGCSRIRETPVPLARYLRKGRPDALIAAMWPMTIAVPLARMLSGHTCRIALSEHNRLSVQYRGWGRAHHLALRSSMAVGYRMADTLVGVSAGVADDMAQLSGLSRNHFNVIHNPVPQSLNTSQAALADADCLWNCAHGARLLAVGRFKRQKNHALLLRAFARVKRPDARLMLIGTGDLEADLRRLAAELAIEQRVIFAGFHADPTPFYRTADLFVLSSDYEGFGNVLVEALACGTPVVSTDCPSGPSEILADGEFGMLVPVDNAGALVQAIEEALRQPHDPERLRARARDFAPEKAAKAYLDLLFPPEAMTQ